jgi:predicted transcriptional regulator
MSSAQIAEHLGIGQTTVSRLRKKYGIERIYSSERAFTQNQIDKIIEVYQSGIGVAGIKDHVDFKVSISNIFTILRQNSIHIRNPSEQQQARMDRCDFYQRQALVKKANQAARGSKKSESSLTKASFTRQIRQNISKNRKFELTVIRHLNDAGIYGTRDKAAYIYNIDFAIGNIAVEVFGGGWSTSPSRIDKYIKKTKELGKCYHFIFVIIPRIERFNADARSNLITCIKEFSSLPPASPCEYRVVWGDLYGAAGLCSDINNAAFENPFKNIRNPDTGSYMSIPK